MTRPIADIERDLASAKVALDDASNLHEEFRRELREAKIADAAHPWLGMKVKRKVRHGYLRGQTQWARGTLRVYGSEEAKGPFRGLYGWQQSYGDLIVVSASGKSARKFRQPEPRLCENETEWELDQ